MQPDSTDFSPENTPPNPDITLEGEPLTRLAEGAPQYEGLPPDSADFAPENTEGLPSMGVAKHRLKVTDDSCDGQFDFLNLGEILDGNGVLIDDNECVDIDSLASAIIHVRNTGDADHVYSPLQKIKIIYENKTPVPKYTGDTLILSVPDAVKDSCYANRTMAPIPGARGSRLMKSGQLWRKSPTKTAHFAHSRRCKMLRPCCAGFSVKIQSHTRTSLEPRCIVKSVESQCYNSTNR